MKGRPSCYLPGDYGSIEFRQAYETALQGRPSVTNPCRLAKRGTFNWLIERYLTSPEFEKIGPVYKRNLLYQIDRFRRAYGDCLIADLRMVHVEAIIAKKANTPAAANELLKLIRRLCRFAIKRGWLETNPTIGVEKYSTNADGYYTWTEADIAQFEAHHDLRSKATLAMRLMLCTGARRATAVRLGWQNIKDGLISFNPNKNGKPVYIRLELVPELVEVLEAVPRENMLFLTHGNQGKGYSPESLGNWFKDQCKAAGLPQCSAHGLRKAGATRLANAGATEFEIMAFLGHKTPDEARTYVKAASRLTLIDSALKAPKRVQPGH